jgi:hypothetical protein
MGGDHPRAFIIDRALAEKTAIESVFPESWISFGLMHIFRNLQQKCGKDHEIVREFWPAMRGDARAQDEYRDLLGRTFLSNNRRAAKKELAGCMGRLWNEWKHFAP